MSSVDILNVGNEVRQNGGVCLLCAFKLDIFVYTNIYFFKQTYIHMYLYIHTMCMHPYYNSQR